MDNTAFNAMRTLMLEALADKTEMGLDEIVKQYNEGGELKRRVDLAVRSTLVAISSGDGGWSLSSPHLFAPPEKIETPAPRQQKGRPPKRRPCWCRGMDLNHHLQPNDD